MRNYLATYQDKRGVINTHIKSDGSTMYLSLRGVAFEGHDFEMLTGEMDDTKFEYEKYEDGSGDLTNFKITITFPIQLFNSLINQTFTEDLVVHIEVGETTTIVGLDSEINSLALSTSFGDFKVEKKLEWMEDALIGIQDQLPKNIFLKTCLSCKYSNYSPYGNGMFGNIYCFKNIKKEFKEVNSKHELLALWTAEAVEKGAIFSVQETFHCNEHQLPTVKDWYYKDWSKLILKEEDIEVVESTLFYKRINSLLRNQFSALKQEITPQYKQLLRDREFTYDLPIICKFEYNSLGYRNRQWRLELDFNAYQWSYKTVKPHVLNALVSLEMAKEVTHFKYQLYSSFNEETPLMEAEKIATKTLNNTDFVEDKINEVKQFLEHLPKHFIQEVKKINFNNLEFLEDDNT